MNESDILIKKRFEELPIELQRILLNFDWKKEIASIAKEKNLSEDQTKALETETLLLLYRFEPQEKFYDNLISEVGVDENITGYIFDLIQDRILAKIAELLDNPGLVIDPQKTTSPLVTTEPKKPELTSIPNYSSYESGKDPYREPIE